MPYGGSWRRRANLIKIISWCHCQHGGPYKIKWPWTSWLMVGMSFAQDFRSNIMGLWPRCIEAETDFSCGIHFNIKGLFLSYVRMPTPRQSATHAHWILGSPQERKRWNDAVCLAQVSCKSFLKFQVGIISLGALFRESRVNTKSPLSNGSTAVEIDLKHCSKTSDMSKSFAKSNSWNKPIKG